MNSRDAASIDESQQVTTSELGTNNTSGNVLPELPKTICTKVRLRDDLVAKTNETTQNFIKLRIKTKHLRFVIGGGIRKRLRN